MTVKTPWKLSSMMTGLLLSTCVLASPALAEPADPPCHSRPHHLMLMAGPGVTDSGAAYTSVGTGYEYRLPYLSNLFGVGAMAELMFMPAMHPMLMAFGSVHPLEGLSLQVAIGAAHVHQPDDPGSTGNSSSGRMLTQPVLRVSAGYDVQLGRLMLSPYLNLDVSGTPRLAFAGGLCLGLML